MLTRVVHAQFELSRVDEAIGIYKELETLFDQLNGLHSMTLHVDRTTGKAMSVAVWESKADMDVSESTGIMAEALQKFASVFASKPVIEEYEVAVQLQR